MSTEHDGHTVTIPTWPAPIVRLARDNDLHCRCGAEVVTRPRRDECPANADGFHRFEANR